MFCIKCGKEINENNKFCNFCGTRVLIKNKTKKKIEKNHIENNNDHVYVWTCEYCGKEFNSKSEGDNHEKNCELNPKNTETNRLESNPENLKPGLKGWLAFLGFGLIIGCIRQIYGLFGYFPLLSDTYTIPGFSSLLTFEFIMIIVYIIINIYCLFLYFKKNNKFPKYYIILSIYLVLYSIIDYIFLSSLSFTSELQQTIDNSLSEASGAIAQNIISAIIWIPYIKKSKQVNITFTNNN
jgi:hypothetical protein